LHYVPHDHHRCVVTMLSGLPGSGKDAWIAAHVPHLPVVSLDGLRAELGVDAGDDQGEVIQAGRERCREHLRASRSFAFNATNLLRQTRRRWIDLFADYDARIEVVYIEPPFPVILDQNAKRSGPVPEKVIRQLTEKCEPPTLAESHGLKLVGRGAEVSRGQTQAGSEART
jgi:predicted kinase